MPDEPPYSRNQRLGAVGKGSPFPAPSDSSFRGDPIPYNPEELLLGAMYSCHNMLARAEAGIVVTDYSDHA